MPLEGKRNTQGSGHKYLNADYLRYLESFYLSSRVTVEGAYSGKHTSPFKGHAQEFTDYRKYYPGDSIKTIDWKVYARSDRYVIKLSELETIMTCYLMVDSSASMAFGGQWHEDFFGRDDMSKFDYACYLAAALSYLTIKQGDKVGLTLFDSNIKNHIPAGSTFTHLYKILNQLERNRVGQGTSVARVLRESFPLFKHRGILILISDLLDDPDEIFGALDMYLHKNFEVVLFHVLHKHEIDLPNIPSANFIDSETRQRQSTIPADIRNSYSRHLNNYIDSISSTAQSRKVDYVLFNTETPYQLALQNYIAGRGKR
jgi:uncharacterized protein (DUF58 family)